jgi:hypothetical protein
MKILEIYNQILESKATEAQALNILKRGSVENPEDIINDMASGDESKNQKNLPVMAFIYANGYTDLKNIISLMNEYNALEIKNRIKPIQLTKNSIKIGDKEFNDFIKFSEFIHGETNKYAEKPKDGFGVSGDFKAEKKPMWSGNGIDIYEGDDVGKCISYTQGSLTGRGYSFCIGQPGNTMYKSYRDKKDSSFYFIIDRNFFKTNKDGGVNLDEPLHIVVLDNTKYGIELTDANNTTGDIDGFGDDVEAYIEYLESMGVPVERLINRPKTDQERYEDELLGKPNDSLEWFMELPIKYKSAYIGRGHILTNAQFDYLIGDN